MHALRTASIRSKLVATTLLATSMAFLGAWAALGVIDLTRLSPAPYRDLRCLAAALAIGWFIGILVAWCLQRSVCAPLAALAEGATAISRARDFSIRLQAAGGDECGRLAVSLNAMLAEIDHRTASLRGQQAELERHIAERTLELRQEVAERTMAEVFARRAREMAEAANAAKDEFLSRMSHELRTPLNAILGFGQLLEMDELTAEQSGEVSQILQAGNHLLALVDDVLDISRLSSRMLELEPRSVSLGAPLHEALATLTPAAAAAGIRLPQPEDLETIAPRRLHADRERLSQVLLQILSNAVKFNRPGGEVRIAALDSCDHKLRIEVTDTGGGIAPEMLERLFKPFDRLDAAERDIAGTGISLVLAQQLVEAMGGTLSAKSQVGEGTTLAIELPLAEEPLAEPTSAADDEPDRICAILYIEEGLPHAALIQECLAAHPSAELLCAGSGWSAFDAVRVRRPDLILLDLHLLDVPGVEMLTRLKTSPITGDIPVALLCAETTPRQVAQLLQAGASHFLSKPLDPWRLGNLLDEVLSSGHANGMKAELL